MNKITIEDDLRRIVKQQWEKVNTHDNDIRRICDAIIQLQAKVNTMEVAVRQNRERTNAMEDWIHTIEDMLSEARERIGDLEERVENMGERVDCIETNVDYIKDNMIESEDTYNPPDDYIF